MDKQSLRTWKMSIRIPSRPFRTGGENARWAGMCALGSLAKQHAGCNSLWGKLEMEASIELL